MDRHTPVIEQARTTLAEAVRSVTRWAVPGGYSARNAFGANPNTVVSMLREDDVLEALEPWLNPNSVPRVGESSQVTMAADLRALPITFTPGTPVRVTNVLGTDGRGREINGMVREDGSIAWDEE